MAVQRFGVWFCYKLVQEVLGVKVISLLSASHTRICAATAWCSVRRFRMYDALDKI